MNTDAKHTAWHRKLGHLWQCCYANRFYGYGATRKAATAQAKARAKANGGAS